MQRRLVAMIAADMVGYSRLMGEDELRTLNAMEDLRRDLFDPVIAAGGGRIVKRMGDGWLVEFGNAADAVACAVSVQKGLADHKVIKLRIGVHMGDVTFLEDDIYGEGINISARLEALAEAGEVVISDTVYHSLDSIAGARFGDGGVQKLKNIKRPVHVWRWQVTGDKGAEIARENAPDDGTAERPSIAVLPFTILSSDPEQEFFADGIVEELITALSRFRWLSVIARATSFSYKDQKPQIRHISQELGIKYLVQGSIRMSPSRVRVSVQLVDGQSERNVWAETYDRPTGDLFDLQDEISQTITGVLVPALNDAERDRSLRVTRPDLDAWMAYQKGLAHYYLPYSDKTHAQASALFDQSIALDPRFADPHAMASLMRSYAINSGQSSYTASYSEILAYAIEAGERAVQLDEGNALAHLALGRAFLAQKNFHVAIAEGEEAIRLNPNFALAYHEHGFVLSNVGRLQESIACFDQAIRLSPRDPSRWNFFLLKGTSQFGLGEHDRAIVNLREASRIRSPSFWPFLALAAPLVELGKMEKARAAVINALNRKPEWTLKDMETIFGKTPIPHHKKWLDNLRLAGLPQE